MLFKRVNRSDPERIFAVFQANEANIAADDVVALESTAASVDGVKISQPSTANTRSLAVGIADAAIANGAYGLVQVYGYRSTSKILLTTSSIAVGHGLRPVNGQDYLESFTTSADVMPFVALETAAASSDTGTVTKKIFIRCL